MKQLGICLSVLLASVAAFSQKKPNYNAGMVTVSDSLWLAGKWVKRITTDTSLAGAADNEIGTAKAVKAYVDNKVINAGGGGSDNNNYASSVQKSGLDVQLVGDQANPGNNKVYGTNGTGTKGYRDDLMGMAYSAKNNGITGTGDKTAALQALANNATQKKILIDENQTYSINGVFDGKGKIFQLANGARFVGSGSIVNIYLEAPDTYDAFDTTLTVSLLNPVIYASWFGGRAGYQYGVQSGVDNYAAITKAIEAARIGTKVVLPANGPTVSLGTWLYCSRKIALSKPIELAGIGTEATILIGAGIRVQTGYSYLHDFSIRKVAGNFSESINGTEHGIDVKGGLNVFERIAVYGFSGNGFNLVGTGANANENTIIDCRAVGNTNGIFLDGNDANANKIYGGFFTANARWGIWDDSFIGNFFQGTTTASNGIDHPLTKTIVRKGDNYYIALKDNINVEPPNAEYWDPKGTVTTFFPPHYTTWSSLVQYYNGGGRYVSDPSATATFIAPYDEYDQTLYIGNGSSDTYGGVGAYYGLIEGAIGTQKGYKTMLRMEARDRTNTQSVQLNSDIGTGEQFMGWTHDIGTRFGWYEDIGGASLGYADAANRGVRLSSPNAPSGYNLQNFAQSTAPRGNRPQFISLDGVWIGVNGSFPAKLLAYGTTAPTDNFHHAGEFVVYAGTDPTILGFRCTVSGTPGAWITCGQNLLRIEDTTTTVATRRWVDSLLQFYSRKDEAVTIATDASFAVTDTMQYIELPPTANDRTLTLPAAAARPGRRLTIVNNAEDAEDWLFSQPVLTDRSNTTLLVPTNKTTILQSNGAVWRVISNQ